MVFTTYLGADGLLDEGFVQRSECPVRRGRKFLGLVHFRADVSATKDWQYYANLPADHPHESSAGGSARRQVSGSVAPDGTFVPEDFYDDEDNDVEEGY